MISKNNKMRKALLMNKYNGTKDHAENEFLKIISEENLREINRIKLIFIL